MKDKIGPKKNKKASAKRKKLLNQIRHLKEYQNQKKIIKTESKLKKGNIKETKPRSTKKFQSNSKFSKSEVRENKLINQDIAKMLQMEQGWAKGTVDRNGNPSTTELPNKDYAWSLMINKITYGQDGNVVVKVNDDFVNSIESEKDEDLNMIQSSVMASISNYKDLSVQDYRDGLFISVVLGPNSVGHSKIFNHKEYHFF